MIVRESYREEGEFAVMDVMDDELHLTVGMARRGS
jgi:hypothetical protein